MSNRREFLSMLGSSAVGLTFSLDMLAQYPPPPIKVEKLSDHIAMVSGDGGNIAVITGADGIMLIDGGYAERAAELFKNVSEQVDPRKIQLLFNTHWHVDHVGCNETLGAAGVKIIAHENVKKRLSVKITIESMDRTFEPLKPVGFPTQEFTKGGKMTFGKEKIEYTHAPLAHTDGDAFLFFPNDNIIHTGDLLFNGFYPVIDYSTGGWVGGMAHACTVIEKTGDAHSRIIPGHGALTTKDELKATGVMLSTVTERLEKMIKAGKSADEAVAAAPTKEFDDKFGHGAFKPDDWTRIAYTSVVRHNQNA